MTHQLDSTELNLSTALFEQLTSQGFDSIAGALSLIVNAFMKIERDRFLQASAFERSEDRVGYANGYKPKTVNPDYS